jgi:hypothetical protein
MSVKSFVLNTLQTLGYELIKMPVASTYKAELSGPSFTEFLNLYLQARGPEGFFLSKWALMSGLTTLFSKMQLSQIKTVNNRYTASGRILIFFNM